MKEYDAIIIGGGPALRNCVKTIRLMNQKAKIACIRKDKTMINHCAMPYIFDGSTKLDKVIIKDETVKKWNADIFIDEAVNINPKERIVTTLNEKFKYRKLFLTTGADPIRPSIEGINLKNIFTLRRTEDVIELEKKLNEPETKNVVIVGGGYVGVEFSCIFRKRGMNVTLIEMLPHIMQASFDEEFSIKAEEILKHNGVMLYTNTKVVGFKGNGKVEKVITENEEIPADVVIFGIGVSPNIDLAIKAGIKTDKNGIIVNKYMETSVENIYAAGDVIKTWSAINGDEIPGRLGSNATVEAKVAAINAFGGQREFPGVINPVGTVIFGSAFGSVGFSEGCLKNQRIEYITGRGKTTSIYSMMPGSKQVEAKIIFEKKSLRLLGAQIIGDTKIAGLIDLISLSLLKKTAIEDILNLQYTTHPELSPEPRANIWVSCAEDAWNKLR